MTYAKNVVPLLRFSYKIMLCEDIHSALSSLLTRYASDQIVVVCDAHVRFETAYPMLRLAVEEKQKNLDTARGSRRRRRRSTDRYRGLCGSNL